jgi:hypothetical protein
MYLSYQNRFGLGKVVILLSEIGLELSLQTQRARHLEVVDIGFVVLLHLLHSRLICQILLLALHEISFVK